MTSKAITLRLNREKQVFQAGIAMVKGDLDTLNNDIHKLHPEEKRRYQQYQYKGRRRSYLLGRLSAKAAITNLTHTKNPETIYIDTGVFQFPIVKCPISPNIQVSISHCDTIGLSVAYPEAHPMGIDVEKISSDKKETILSQLTVQEQALIKAKKIDTVAIYTAIFSAKEALSKVIKTGMMLDFKFLEVDEIKVEQQLLNCTFAHFGQYKAVVYLRKNYVFSLVLPKRTKIEEQKLWQLFT